MIYSCTCMCVYVCIVYYLRHSLSQFREVLCVVHDIYTNPSNHHSVFTRVQGSVSPVSE